MPEGYSTDEIPSIFSIFQVPEENLDKIENKLLLYKSIPPSAIQKLPYWKICSIIDDWLEDIDKQKKEKKRQEEEMKKQQKQYQPKQPSFNQPKFPSPPKWKP